MRPIKGSETLLEEMKQYLPIPARPTRELCQVLGQKGTHLDPDQDIEIIDVLDSGDMGGIVCTIKEGEKHVLVVSITHLIIKPDHPLSDKITDYQKKRVKRLRRYG